MEKKIRFKDLSWPLKTGIIVSLFNLSMYIIQFLAGVIYAFMP